jgi:RNA 2',3'-cyclic 3'-phosphodiesterase
VHRSPTARLFVAVDPSQDVCEQLVAWTRGALRGIDRRSTNTPARVLDAELLHVTLCFLGNRPVAEIDAIAAQLAACDGTSGELSVGAPLWLPPRRPRALAVELHDSGELAHLRAQFVAALREPGNWQAGGGAPRGADAVGARRRFRPHVTVARMGRGASRIDRVLPPTPSLSFVPRQLVLYRSRLSPQGANYEAIASHPIG